jgi:hypothetical protein
MNGFLTKQCNHDMNEAPEPFRANRFFIDVSAEASLRARRGVSDGPMPGE